MLSPAEWLAGVGFVNGTNPFALRRADAERDRLQEYFVEHAAYHAILDAGPAQSAILHAPRGAGKSSTRQMFEAFCAANEPELQALIIRLIDWMPILKQAGGPADVTVAILLDEILRLTALALADSAAPPSPAQLDPDSLACLRWIGSACDAYLAPRQQRVLYERGWAAPVDPRYDLRRLPESRAFGELAAAIRAGGFQRCYIVIDGVDELLETTADWAAGAAVLAPLIGNLRLLEIPDLALKYFVPSEIVAILNEQGLIRTDRIPCVELTWSLQMLQDLLRARLDTYSEGAIVSLAMLADPDLGDVDAEICRAAAGSPRRLLMICDRLVQICAADSDDDQMLLRRHHLDAALRAVGAAAPPIGSSGPEHVSDAPPPLRLAADGSVWRGEVQIAGWETLPLLQRRLLTYLHQQRGKSCSTDELIAAVWDDREPPSEPDALRKLVNRLSKFLEPDPRVPNYIQKIQGGYYVLRHSRDDRDS